MALSALSWVWRGSPFLHGMALVSHMGLHLKLTFMGGTVKRGVMGFGVLYFRNCQAKSSSYLEVLKVISIWGQIAGLQFPSFEMTVQKTTFAAGSNSDLFCQYDLLCQ